MSEAPMIAVQVNGESREIPAGSTLLALLHSLGIDEKRVAVEWNRRIVRSEAWPVEVVQDGDEIEVVHFVGGG